MCRLFLVFAGRREQLNDMTSYIDASQVYGASTEHAYKLRSFVNGSLVVVMNQMLPGGADSSCVRTNTTQRCFLAGIISNVLHLVKLT